MFRYAKTALLLIASMLYISVSAGTCTCKIGSPMPTVSHPQPGVTISQMNYSETLRGGVPSRQACKELCKKVRRDFGYPRNTPVNYSFKP